MTADVHFNYFTTRLFFQKETKIKILEGNQNRNFRWKLNQIFLKETKYFGRKSRQSKPKQKFRSKPKYTCREETKNFSRKTNILEVKLKTFGRKLKILEGNQSQNFRRKPKR